MEATSSASTERASQLGPTLLSTPPTLPRPPSRSAMLPATASASTSGTTGPLEPTRGVLVVTGSWRTTSTSTVGTRFMPSARRTAITSSLRTPSSRITKEPPSRTCARTPRTRATSTNGLMLSAGRRVTATAAAMDGWSLDISMSPDGTRDTAMPSRELQSAKGFFRRRPPPSLESQNKATNARSNDIFNRYR